MEKLERRRIRNSPHVKKPENIPVPHTPKKPTLAVTGTKPDRLCAICLGRLEPGAVLTFCNCGKYFHMACIYELGECPVCNFAFNSKREIGVSPEADEKSIETYNPDSEVVEVVFQCPVCESYVSEDAERCQCGAVFDVDKEIYLCPQCEHEVKKDSERCENCGTDFE